MRKAKVVAIVCGMIASCLFGGFAVVEAATITLDDSSAIDVVETVEATTEDATESATTVTSIKTTAPATTSTTTIASDKTRETTAAMKETTSAASVMTTAVKNEAAVNTTAKHEPKVTAIAVKVNTQPAAVKATTSVQTTTVKTTTTTTKTTTVKVTTTKAATAAATQAPAPVTEAVLTNPPMPEQNVTETVTEPTVDPVVPVEPEIPPVAEEPGVVVTPEDNAVSESDYILLCNAVAHEAGANSISTTEKAKVVEVIMNRVNSPNYPNTIYEVLTQKYQFSGSSSYVDLGTYSSKVTDMVKESVDLYFADPSVFNEGYLSFTGDGVRNYFK